MRQPDIVVRMDSVGGTSWIARDHRGELLETTTPLPDGMPDWTDATVCDQRGAGDIEGYRALMTAFESLEKNYEMVTGGRSPVAVGEEWS